MMKKPDFSVIIPVYNSEKALNELTEQLFEVFNTLQRSWELIFVDDHSSDTSWKVIQGIQQEHSETISCYHLARNFGQHNATLCGIQKSKAAYIITIDDDLQQSPYDIVKLVNTQKETGAELVYGIYKNKSENKLRRFQSRFFKVMSNKINHSPEDGSSFRLITRRLADKVNNFSMRFVYLDDMLYWHTEAISFTKVNHYPSKYRKSGYNTSKRANILYNLVLFNSTLPLKFMTFGGLGISVLAAIVAIWFIFRKLVYDVPMGYTSTIVAILFSTALIVFSLGIIGEYLRRLYLNQTGNPAYSIDTEAVPEEKKQDHAD